MPKITRLVCGKSEQTYRVADLFFTRKAQILGSGQVADDAGSQETLTRRAGQHISS
jgi:hypothetical protein